MESQNNSHHGFTLIELSIVLVIIGLVVGGILVGQDLIRTAELNSIISQKTQYNVAVNTFRGKYGGLPGDIPNATQFFGIAGGSASDNYTTSCSGNETPSSPATCNGDGNGFICGGGIYWSFMCEEGLRLWQQLANAGLISGRYTPRWSPTVGSYEVVGVNIPASKASSNAGFSLFFLCLTSNWGATYFQNGYCAHTIFYGGQDPNSYMNWEGTAFWPVFTGQDARRIDTKLDDGLPAKGTVTSMTGGIAAYNSRCTTTTDPTTALYDTATPGLICSLMFKTEGF